MPFDMHTRRELLPIDDDDDGLPEIVAIAGTTTLAGPTNRLIVRAAERLAAQGHEVTSVLLPQVPAAALAEGDLRDPQLAAAVRLVGQARALVFASPARLVTFCAALERFLAVLPADSLRDKIVLPIATGPSRKFVAAFDRALGLALARLGAPKVLPTLFVAVDDVHGDPRVDPTVTASKRLDRALQGLRRANEARARQAV
jgi:FMN reductase